MSGITTTDLASVSADAIHSFSTLSFKFMPAATVNSMSATQLAGLSHVQVVALLNSPYYSSFSTTVTSALASATDGTTTSGATQITLTYFAKFLMGFTSFYYPYFMDLRVCHTKKNGNTTQKKMGIDHTKKWEYHTPNSN